MWESGAHCWLAGWLLAGWLAIGTPGSERTCSGDGNGTVPGGLVALNTVHGTRYKVPRYKAFKLPRLVG